MAWNRRATKDKRHPGKNNPKDQWVISSIPTHPPLVSVDKFLAAQSLMSTRAARPGRDRHRADLEAMAPNSHPETKRIYKMRSYVWCVPCQRRMHGHTSRSGTPYAYCQPRNHEVPEGHPAAVRVREDELIEAATWFFNHHILGPERLALIQASMPAASDFVREQHKKAEAVIRRRIADLDSSMDNLMRVLEREHDPGGQLFKRTKRRIGELEKELAEAEAQLRRHIASAPPEREDNAGLLEHLPQIQVDLNQLAADRLRRLLDAFRGGIHYDIRTGRATFRAEISADVIDQLVLLVRRAEAARSVANRHGRSQSDLDEMGPADTGESQTIMGNSFSKCTQPVSIRTLNL
jgi:site-specific DNA recombinase